MNVDSLSDERRAILAQLQDIVSGGSDVQKEIAVLESVNWDLSRAVDSLLDDEPSRSIPTSSYNPSSSSASASWNAETSADHAPFARLDVDDSSQTVPTTTRHTGAGHSLSRVGFQLVSALAYPVTVTFNLIIYILRLLRIPIPRFSARPFSFSIQSLLWGPRRLGAYEDAGTVAERWVRGLEEDLGALTLSRRRAHLNETSQGHSDSSNGAASEAVLPDFYLGSYEDALNCAKRELRVLCVILVSEEHDDVPEFKRTTLVDPRFVERLHDENFLVWGGDVRDREPYSAALKLGATTYPFISFISLQPSRVPGLANPNQPLLTVLSRHSGPASPPSGPTSTTALLTHIENRLLPRVRTVFDRVRNEEMGRAAERQMREDQDRAFQESERRDRERILARREAERQAQEQARAEEEERRRQEKRKENAALWRRYARRNLVVPEPTSNGGPSVRIGVRLPNGERVIRKFKESDGLDALYAWAGASFIPAHDKPEHDPAEPPSRSEWRIEDEGWGFKLAVAYPRSEVPWVSGKTIGEVEALKGGVQLVVEDIAPASTSTVHDADDDYLSEEE
ncbi:hypothetical protein SISNIDRAFT_491072 [Sistotremastrum niveocremeum HHB9708]|uniref:UBX domain-containing protein n=1 Tax=Sistotremastrum niveocremeum HHB9708 TaxID=1314777 RepID=A0A164N6Q1_9AGAM|nr:hypothetical protein SISNIDRAFT_491072 [Sistotremastrum niveocremeum HHB9708]